MKIFDALVATGLLISPAVALDGELVTNDAFPFVPTPYFNICTATVPEPRLILTAAHCISKPYPGTDGPDSFVPNISKDITIYYTDADGRERTAKSKSTFHDRAFLSNRFKYTRIMPKLLNEVARAKYINSLAPSEQEMRPMLREVGLRSALSQYLERPLVGSPEFCSTQCERLYELHQSEASARRRWHCFLLESGLLRSGRQGYLSGYRNVEQP